MKSNTKLYFALFLSVVLFSFSCTDYTGGGNQGNQNRPEIVLTYQEMHDMLKYYDDTRKEPLSLVNKREDAREHYVDLAQLKAYIRYVEKEAKKSKIKVEGINFISAAYPMNYKDNDKKGYQTIIMVPATTIDKEPMVSFDPFKSTKGNIVSLKEVLHTYYGYDWYYDKITLKSTQNKSSRSTQKSGGDEYGPAGNRMKPSPPN